jgi:hypothetical protein
MPKKSTIDTLIEHQELFIKQVELTLMFLKFYKGNPESAELHFSDEIIEHYQMDFVNPEFMAESFDELAYDIYSKRKKFSLSPNGLFTGIKFKDKKSKEAKIEEILRMVDGHDGSYWEI